MHFRNLVSPRESWCWKSCYSVNKVQWKQRFTKFLTGYKESAFSSPCSNYIHIFNIPFASKSACLLKYCLCYSARDLFLLTWVHDYTVNSLIQCKSPYEAYTRKFTTVFPFYLKTPSVHEWMKAQDVQAHSFRIKVFCWNCSTCSQPSKKKKPWGLHFVEELYKSLNDDFKY